VGGCGYGGNGAPGPARAMLTPVGGCGYGGSGAPGPARATLTPVGGCGYGGRGAPGPVRAMLTPVGGCGYGGSGAPGPVRETLTAPNDTGAVTSTLLLCDTCPAGAAMASAGRAVINAKIRQSASLGDVTTPKRMGRTPCEKTYGGKSNPKMGRSVPQK
jgi:hypothetical protein